MNSHTLTSAHITAYARFLLDEERASATVEKYIRDIRSFASWLEGREVSKDTVVQWKSDLLAQDKAPSTVNGKLSALNGLFGFLGWDDRKIKFLKLQKKVFRETDRDKRRIPTASGNRPLPVSELAGASDGNHLFHRHPGV